MSAERPQAARLIAYDILRAVADSDAYANLLLPVRLARAALAPADAALATELTYGTLRMQGYYDRVIALAAGRPVERIDPEILDVLRLGAHQLLSMRVASHAAVNESVAMARNVGSRSATGFANAVLREIGRADADSWRERVRAAAANADDALGAVYSHPTWVLRAFRRALAAEGHGSGGHGSGDHGSGEHGSGDLETELIALLAADNRAPKVNLAALPGIAQRPTGAEANLYSPIGFVLSSGDPATVARDGGGVRVQDEGSQLAALTLSRARPVAPGERWLDLCAGPGGKAALLAAEATIGGASLTANEIVPARLELVRRAIGAPSGAVDCAVDFWDRDGRRIGDDAPGAFDRILLDAPCTGLGALRRRPEARWRKTPRDVAELTPLQAQLIDSAVRALKPGGILAYVTCSPHPAETRLQVADALKRWGGRLRALDTADALRHVVSRPIELAGPPEGVQLWPHRHGTDAMFIALLTVD